MIDIRACKTLIARYEQYLAYKNHVISFQANKTTAKAINVLFSIGLTFSIRSPLLNTSIVIIKFHIIKVATFFLLCFEDINKFNIYFNNLKNVIIISTKLVLVICCFGQLFFL